MSTALQQTSKAAYKEVFWKCGKFTGEHRCPHAEAWFQWSCKATFRSNLPAVFLEKVVLKICCKFTGEHPCRSVISIKLFCNFIKITLQHGYFQNTFLYEKLWIVASELYWSYTTAWVSSYKFAPYFQNMLS